MKVTVVDDSVAIRFGLPQMLPDLKFTDSFYTAEAFLDAAPDCDAVLLDLRLTMPGQPGGLQGTGAVRAIAARGYAICLYTDERRPLVLAQCLQAGAAAIAHKSDAPDRLRDALARLHTGETVITHSLVGLAEVVERSGQIRELTGRQRQVLTARARGEQWAAIALRLAITEPVAREHMAAATAKFAEYLQGVSPSDLERHLGIGPGDLLEVL